MPADREIAKYLQDLGIGTVGTSIFAGTIPAGVATAIGITQYPGSPPELTCGSNGWTLERPRLQVTVRDPSEAGAIATARTVVEALTKVAGQTIEGIRYRAVTVLQSPGLLFRDENDRAIYGCNVEVEKVPS
jgi:hypothetical protein